MADKLNVFFNHFKIGKLWLDNQNRFCFQYYHSWLNHPKKQPLSISLPLRNKPYLNDNAFSYFTNLLPEGNIVTVLSRKLGMPENDYFGLLKAIGGDCAGAVSLYPKDAILPDKNNYSYEPLAKEHLLKKIMELKDNPFLIHEEKRMSLAGAQEKLPIYIKDEQIYLSLNGSPSSHILKTPIENLQGTVSNETYCMMLAREMGMDVPDVKILNLGSFHVYIIKRYDRAVFDGQIIRLVQEDFCQALNINSHQKYDLTFRECFDLIYQECSSPITDSRRLLELIIFNGLIGNADGHAKNISLIHDEESTKLAPFYDLLCTKFYSEFTKKMPLKIDGKKREFNHLKTKHFRGLGEEIGIKPDFVIKTAREMSKKIIRASKKTTKKFEDIYGHNSVVDQINMIIKGHSDSITNEL